MEIKKYEPRIKSAIRSFWETKNRQRSSSGDITNRGAVIGGKQLDAFIELLSAVAMDFGIPLFFTVFSLFSVLDKVAFLN